MIRPWFRQAAVLWKTTATQTRASGEDRVSTKLGVLHAHLGGGGAGGGLVGDRLARGVGGEQGGDDEPADGAGVAAGGVVDERGGVIAEQRSGAAGEAAGMRPRTGG